MSIASLLKRLTNALPVLLAAAPSVIEAVNQVRLALKKPKKENRAGGEGAVAAPPTAGRLSADSGQGAR